MCLSVFLLLSFFMYNPPCPHHHWETVEVVSRREMMPNLTGVEPYLFSLHSCFCFKGFVYTRPINHLLPSHNPTAFKVCSTPGDNTQHRCQCKSHLLQLPTKRRFTDLCSRCPLSFLCYLFMAPSALITISNYRTKLAGERSDYQTFAHHTLGLESVCHVTPFNEVLTADWHCPLVITAYVDRMLLSKH